ncbi:MAG: putative glycoside hydrolase [Gaiellales bacterium]
MRRILIGLTAVLALVGGCGGSAAPSVDTSLCPTVPRPTVALTDQPRAVPSRLDAACLAQRYANLVGDASWGSLPRVIAATSPSTRTWQRRLLLYAVDGCRNCPGAGLDLEWVQRHHPEWILHDALGRDVHPLDHPTWVLLDFGNPDEQAAWAARVQFSLASGGWSGVEVTDASNEPEWSSLPIDPRTNQPMTDTDRATYLAQALTLVRGALKTSGFSLVAVNDPPSIVEASQIGSTDGVTVQMGFARLRNEAWLELFRYFQAADGRFVGAWVADRRGPLDRSQLVYGLASYLLVSGPLSSYEVAADPADPLYRIDPGAPLQEAQEVNGAWVRTFAGGTVAVNPGDVPVTVPLGTAGDRTLPPGGAAIVTSAGVLSAP